MDDNAYNIILIVLLIVVVFIIFNMNIDEHYTPITVEANEAIQNMANILNSNNATISNATINNLKITGTLDAANQSQTTTPKITINSGSTPKFNIFSGGNDYLHIQNGSGNDAMTLGQAGDVYFSNGLYGTSINTSSNASFGGQVTTSGTGGGLVFQDRTNTNNAYTLYSSGGPAYLYNNGNIVSFDKFGNIATNGTLSANGGITTKGIVNSNGGITTNGILNANGGITIGNTTIKPDGTIVKVMDNTSCGSNVNFGGPGYSAGPYASPMDCYNYCKKTFPSDGSNSGQIARCASYQKSGKGCWCCTYQSYNVNNQFNNDWSAVYEV